MKLNQRKIFKSTQDWHEFIGASKGSALTGRDLNELRKNVYSEIESLRGRPLLVYASKFISPVPREASHLITISLEDVDGFTDLVNSVDDKHKTVDVLIHSPGGSPDATERIVQILRGRFEEVHFLVPHSAYSAATMLALSGDTITLHKSATLGPIDPQLDGVPVRSITRGFEKAKRQIQKEGPESLPAYVPLIEKYSIHLLEMCEDSEKLSRELVSNWLTKYMFKNDNRRKTTIKKAVKYFSSYDKHRLHSRPLFMEKIGNLNLSISIADQQLEELLWESYILLTGFFNISPFVKLYESNNGVSWGRQFQQVMVNP
jgi:hypothetical protein